jgi:hypothetical protein
VGATAFSALLPMHVAMTVAVNNDTLAELLLVAAMLVLLYWMRHEFYLGSGRVGPADGDPAPSYTGIVRTWREDGQSRRLGWLGLLIGLGLITKIYAYLLFPICVATVIIVRWQLQRNNQGSRAYSGTAEVLPVRPAKQMRAIVQPVLWIAVPAVTLAAPMWVRNMILYGRWDFLGLQWHDEVVVGQAKTLEWIGSYGWVAYSERAFGFTFRSFWGVFGWMGVFLDERIYTALLLFTGVIFLGLLWSTVRFISGGTDTDMDLFQIWVLLLFGSMLLAVTLSYLWYNTKFVQHQGRYFFWGLLPISTIVALGWREVLQPMQGIITGFLAVVMAASIAATNYVTGDMEKWTLLSVALIALLLLLQPLLLSGTHRNYPNWLPVSWQRWMRAPSRAPMLRRLRILVWALPFILLFLLDLLIPVIFIMPQLAN